MRGPALNFISTHLESFDPSLDFDLNPAGQACLAFVPEDRLLNLEPESEVIKD